MFTPGFNISVSRAPEGHHLRHQPSSGFEWDDCDSEHSIIELDHHDKRAPIFNLSIDILAMIIEYLSFHDIVALSLTTKGFRHLNRHLPSSTSTPPPSPGNEALCSARIHQRFLPPRPHNYSQKCPYCLHPLCPPTCASALFLDTATGIFFPASLYPLYKAHFRYRTGPPKQEPALTVSAPTKRGSFIGTQRDSFILPHGSNKRYSATFTPKPLECMYSTIWCEHHRCPRDMLTQKKSYDINGNNGVEKFLQEYHNERQWKQTRRDRGPRYQLWARWLVGYKAEQPPPLPSPSSTSGSRKSIVPWFDRDRESSQPTPPPSASSGSHRKSLFSWLDRFKDLSDLEDTKRPDPVRATEIAERQYQAMALRASGARIVGEPPVDIIDPARLGPKAMAPSIPEIVQVLDMRRLVNYALYLGHETRGLHVLCLQKKPCLPLQQPCNFSPESGNPSWPLDPSDEADFKIYASMYRYFIVSAVIAQAYWAPFFSDNPTATRIRDVFSSRLPLGSDPRLDSGYSTRSRVLLTEDLDYVRQWACYNKTTLL
ncbi:hypothetical protein ABW21_db0208639 [Orbilia brochopaga]|nr:hypothetical protein ABW21_db0208639 [Drechslerella brochopaga]